MHPAQDGGFADDIDDHVRRRHRVHAHEPIGIDHRHERVRDGLTRSEVQRTRSRPTGRTRIQRHETRRQRTVDRQGAEHRGTRLTGTHPQWCVGADAPAHPGLGRQTRIDQARRRVQPIQHRRAAHNIDDHVRRRHRVHAHEPIGINSRHERVRDGLTRREVQRAGVRPTHGTRIQRHEPGGQRTVDRQRAEHCGARFAGTHPQRRVRTNVRRLCSDGPHTEVPVDAGPTGLFQRHGIAARGQGVARKEEHSVRVAQQVEAQRAVDLIGGAIGVLGDDAQVACVPQHGATRRGQTGGQLLAGRIGQQRHDRQPVEPATLTPLQRAGHFSTLIRIDAYQCAVAGKQDLLHGCGLDATNHIKTDGVVELTERAAPQAGPQQADCVERRGDPVVDRLGGAGGRAQVR